MGWLKEELSERGVRAKACYEACQVSQPTWNKIEIDPTILTARQIEQLSQLLRCEPVELFEKILMFDRFMREGS